MSVDNSTETKLVRYFKHLGLDQELAQIYLFLLQNGPKTVLSISRGLKTGRTKLYPALEELADKNLVTIHERHYGTSYEAQPPKAIEFIVAEKERKSAALRGDMPKVLNLLEQLQLQSPTTSRIAEYRGVDGLKQMNFNLTKADKEFRVFELAGLDKHLGKHFADKMSETFAENNLTSFDLTNNPERHLDPAFARPEAQTRYIDPKVFAIEFETYIYNNVVALLSYDKEDIFGIEIYNDKLARQQKQIFDLIWSQASALS